MISHDSDLWSVCRHFNVSRETYEKLELYSQLLVKWNKSINLVSKSTLEERAVRHFADSLQLWKLRKNDGPWVDIGSGAGFPGLVLAIVGSEYQPMTKFHLIESDARKSAFLRNVSRETGISVTVHTNRVEKVKDLKARIISARALASLNQLFSYTENVLADDGICLYLKGQNVQSELLEAKQTWTFNVEGFESETDKDGKILRVRNIARVN